jgi:hypothetical protein
MVRKLWRWMLRGVWTWLCESGGDPSLLSTRRSGVGWVLRGLLLLFLFASFFRGLAILTSDPTAALPPANSVRIASFRPTH